MEEEPFCVWPAEHGSFVDMLSNHLQDVLPCPAARQKEIKRHLIWIVLGQD